MKFKTMFITTLIIITTFFVISCENSTPNSTVLIEKTIYNVKTMKQVFEINDKQNLLYLFKLKKCDKNNSCFIDTIEVNEKIFFRYNVGEQVNEDKL